MITAIYTINKPDQKHLDEVKRLMQTMGAPTIRVVDCKDYYMAIEGMHRLQAACELGIAPILDVLGQNDIIDVSQMDIGYMFWPDCKYTAGEIAYECCGVGAGCYRINNDGTLTLVYESLISVC